MGGWRTKEPEARVLILIPPDVLSDRGQTRVFLNLGSLTYTEVAEAFSDFGLLPEKPPEEQKAASVTSTVTSLAPWRSGAGLPWASARRREPHGRTKDGGEEGRQTAASGSQSPRFPGGTSRGEQTRSSPDSAPSRHKYGASGRPSSRRPFPPLTFSPVQWFLMTNGCCGFGCGGACSQEARFEPAVLWAPHLCFPPSLLLRFLAWPRPSPLSPVEKCWGRSLPARLVLAPVGAGEELLLVSPASDVRLE